jgi:3-oxoacyl-[acyl-carrier protein] reductase
MNKTVLITGSSQGIGRQTALEFAGAGYNVVINYNSSKQDAYNLDGEIRNLGGNSCVCQADVSDQSEAERLVNCAIRTYGKIDVLINNAAISSQKLFTDITLHDWRKIFAVNVEGVFNCSKFAVADMLKYHKGKIINISSIWGVVGASCEVHYSASKAAVIGLTKALAKELGPSNIQVNCVAPGVIETNMNKNLNPLTIKTICEQTPMCRIGTPGDVAKIILFLSGEDADFITGQVISPNGGLAI